MPSSTKPPRTATSINSDVYSVGHNCPIEDRYCIPSFLYNLKQRMKPVPPRLPCHPSSILSIQRRYLNTSACRSHLPRTPPTTTTSSAPPSPIPGYRLPRPRPSKTPPIPPPSLISDSLPLPPVLEFPTRYIPYSKRNPKLRPIPGHPHIPLSPLSEALRLNPYAQILASPIRNASPYQIRLPSFLLVKFGVIRKPIRDSNPEASNAPNITTSPTTQPQQSLPQTEPKQEVCLLPSNLSPETHNRQITMQGMHIYCRKKVFEALLRRSAWRRIIPYEGSRGSGDIIWRVDMALYVERLLRERVVWQLKKMMEVSPGGSAVVEATEEGEKGAKENDDVGCILLWDDAKKHTSTTPDPPTHNHEHLYNLTPPSNPNLKSPFPPIYDMYTLFPQNTSPASQHPNKPQKTADDIKALLGLNKNTKRAVIKSHEATVKAQMWLFKLRFYGS